MVNVRADISAESLANLERVVHADPADSMNLFAGFKNALAQKEIDRAFGYLQKLMGASQTAAMQTACLQLLPEIFAERRSLALALSAQMPDLLLRTGDSCLRAQRKEELEPITCELDKTRRELAKIDCESTREASARLEEALAFVQLWRKYLETHQISGLVEAKARLRHIANIGISHLMIERSRLITEDAKMIVDESAATPPAAPSNPIYERNTDGSAEISWTNNDESADHVVVQKQTLEGKWVILEELPPNVSSFHIPSPVPQS